MARKSFCPSIETETQKEITMPLLQFKAADVRRVVEHTLAAPKQGKTWGRATRITEPSVLLVHDEGVYLMSNGEPRDIVEGESSFVAHAKGCNPKTDPDWWDYSRALVGGDDFGECLPWAKELKAMLDAGTETIVLKMDEQSVVLMKEE
jgi:hypothetical protein